MGIFDLFRRMRSHEEASSPDEDVEAQRVTEQVNPTMMATSAPQHPDWYWYFCRFCSKYVLSTLANGEHLCYDRGVNSVLPPRGLDLLRGRGSVHRRNESWIFYTQIRIPSRRAESVSVFSLQPQSTFIGNEEILMGCVQSAKHAVIILKMRVFQRDTSDVRNAER